MQNVRVYKPSTKKQRHHIQLLSSAADLPKAIKSTMKYFLAILLLAFVAISMAVETSEGKAKESQDADAARDKRGLSSYYSPYAYAPYAYNAYNLPYSYSAYPYSAYPYYNQHYYNYPYYNQLSHYY